jgi:hypothetical protein
MRDVIGLGEGRRELLFPDADLDAFIGRPELSLEQIREVGCALGPCSLEQGSDPLDHAEAGADSLEVGEGPGDVFPREMGSFRHLAGSAVPVDHEVAPLADANLVAGSGKVA